MQPLNEFRNTWQYLIPMINYTIHIADETFFFIKINYGISHIHISPAFLVSFEYNLFFISENSIPTAIFKIVGARSAKQSDIRSIVSAIHEIKYMLM